MPAVPAHLRRLFSRPARPRIGAFAVAGALLLTLGAVGPASSRDVLRDPCARPAPGSAVPEPKDLRSRGGVLKVDLAIRSHQEPDGTTRYCYLTPDGTQSPNLRVHPGDLLVLRLKNELGGLQASAAPLTRGRAMCMVPVKLTADPCTSGAMSATATNLHFHGLTVPALCHQDDVLKTSIAAGAPAFEYRLRIPRDEPPGLYWYHPHIHGFSAVEVSGGASGALIVEGLERADSAVAGLPERVLVIRDQPLVNPNAAPAKSEPVVPKLLIDRDGDSANNGTGFGKPARDLSLNYVAVPYPDYPPASIAMRPGEKQLWRVLNASAVTYLNLELLYGRSPQRVGVVAIDGVPINVAGKNAAGPVASVFHVGIPPGARAEFIVTAPPPGVPAVLATLSVNTGQGGENDPNRVLASITTAADAPEPHSTLPKSGTPLPPPARPWIGDVTPVRERKLYFSEKLQNPNDPNSATEFYLTVDGQTPAPFDPAATTPNIVVHQGDVEDWIIENRSTELHAFHIHQLHFQLRQWSGVEVDEPFLRDTVNVPFLAKNMLSYPSVRLRMDFRGADAVGTFVYHCHLLEHEDGGMMGTIRVEPAKPAPGLASGLAVLGIKLPQAD